MDGRKHHGRRRSRDGGFGRQLRSPVIQRPAAARVTLQGWLHKQGSEGLMLWKRRWFVLSEYCLFYYKGPEEEKLLGSILLPSYAVSPCAPDDRVFRKFCFKAEHHNMRTYYFAADSRELMVRWMNALSLASILQIDASTKWAESIERPSVSSMSHSADDSDSGFHGFRSPSDPVSGGSRQVGDGAAQPPPSVPADGAGTDVNGWPPRFQPLYANAPPKPRRLTNQEDSPEPSPEYGLAAPQLAPEYVRTEPPRHKFHLNGAVSERRTPDTYGRSNATQHKDYEDVHAERYVGGPYRAEAPVPARQVPNKTPQLEQDNIYRAKKYPVNKSVYVKPVGPPPVEHHPISPPSIKHNNSYIAFRMSSPAPPPTAQIITQQRRPKSQPPRPHSADFLEKDTSPIESRKSCVVMRSPAERSDAVHDRPKSSIDMYHDYWSEESYAQKMRQSLYLHAQAGRSNTPVQRPGLRPVSLDPQQVRSATNHAPTSQYDEHAALFLRSASARLPRHKHVREASEAGSDRKTQQREESMQRLLEWKQRMLQSPLTRKASPRPTNDAGSTPPVPLSQIYTLRGVSSAQSESGGSVRSRRQTSRTAAGSLGSARSRSQDPGRRSAPLLHRRNSYSSDDEEVDREPRGSRHASSRRPSAQQQAGRTRQVVGSAMPSSSVDAKCGSARRLNFAAPHGASPDYVNVNALTAQQVGSAVREEQRKTNKVCPARAVPSPAALQRHAVVNDIVAAPCSAGKPTFPYKLIKNEPELTSSLGVEHTVQPDESSLIKEFSYQYIRDPRQSQPDATGSKKDEQSAAQSAANKESLKMQEPLQPLQSIYQLNEAHVSTLKFSEREDLMGNAASPNDACYSHQHYKNLAVASPEGETSPSAKPLTRVEAGNTSRSVQDLLADFERKSAALAAEQRKDERERHKQRLDAAAGRCVFSDTETLLYDTSSDAEPFGNDHKSLPRTATHQHRKGAPPSDEEDDEVAAALGRRDKFVNRRRGEDGNRVRGEDTNRRRSEDSNARRRRSSKVKAHTEVIDEVIVTPGYLRLSLADSLVAHEDSDSCRSSPSPLAEKDGEAADKAPEEHYMPMTPSRRPIFAPADSCSFVEESSYVEMAEDGGVRDLPSVFEQRDVCSLGSSVSSVTNTIIDTAADDKQEQSSHYELLCLATSKYEPVYMEVEAHASLRSDSQDANSKRRVDGVYSNVESNSSKALELPDILNSTNLAESQQSKMGDSDDADDEASKDLESLDTPTHPRFSLSDTFRPASYYLGARTSTPEQHDSSDSDLVSPPPIPTSPPPLDEDDEPDYLLDAVRNGCVTLPTDVKVECDVSQCGSGSEHSANFNDSESPRSRQFSLPKDGAEADSMLSKFSMIGNLLESRPLDVIRESSESLHENSGTANRHQLENPPAAAANEYVRLPEASSAELFGVSPDRLLKMSRHVRSSSLEEALTGASGQGMDGASAPYYYSDLLRQDAWRSSASELSVSKTSLHSNSSAGARAAPLNNQRDMLDGNKRNDIGRKVNPIMSLHLQQQDEGNVLRLTDELRFSTAGISDKRVPVDSRNIYEPSSLHYVRHEESSKRRSRTPDIESRNAYPYGAPPATCMESRRRSRSLEGLLDRDDDILETSTLPSPNSGVRERTRRKTGSSTLRSAPSEGSEPWEQDVLWRESLRRVSVRHTRSLDNLDDDAPQTSTSGRASVDMLSHARPPPKFSRDVTYVNDPAARARVRNKREEYQKDLRKKLQQPVPQQQQDDGVYETLVVHRYHQRPTNGQHGKPSFRAQNQSQNFLEEGLPPSFELDREKLRQWDLLSSAPLEGTVSQEQPWPVGGEGMRDATTPKHPSRPLSPKGEHREGGRHLSSESNHLGGGAKTISAGARAHALGPAEPLVAGSHSQSVQDHECASMGGQVGLICSNCWNPGSGSGSIHDMAATPRHATRHHKPHTAPATQQNRGRSTDSPNLLGGHTVADQPDGGSNTSDSELRKPPSSSNEWSSPGYNVSAGELLGRTHEELVLLLIQLRRQSAALRHSAELCRSDVLAQARLMELDASRRAEHLHRLEELKLHLQQIEKQYEKGKPLVHLVDNMVKLGSLYRGPGAHSVPRATCTPPPIQRLEFNLQLQEQRFLAEEKRDWNRLSPPDHVELQAKVQQLYRLDRLLHDESVTIQGLQQDKALLERALGGLRHKLAGSSGAEAERYRRQQRLLERELSRVRHLLAANSKKLEETVAENARLEHELLLLRQKLQAAPRCASPLAGSSVLELELRRVQSLVGDLQRQRHDLSAQVRQLTEKSQSLAQQIRPPALPTDRLKQRRPSASWIETDLDSSHAGSPPRHEAQDPRSPLYVNTDAFGGPSYGAAGSSEDMEELSPPPPPAPDTPLNATVNGALDCYEPQDINDADERTKRFYGIIPRAEKAEIKTVRIVKRESERRSRVKRPTTLDGDLGRLVEEDSPPPPSELELSLLMELQHDQEAAALQRSLSLPRGYGKQPPPPPPMRAVGGSNTMRSYVARYQPASPEEHGHAPPMFERACGEEDASAAECSSGPVSPVYQSEAARAIVQEMTGLRRAVPKNKRRHHTIAGRLQQSLAGETATGARARDDLDMERALRRRVAGAPDVVRSTLSHRELKYNEGTIDSILGTPNKIIIPERYVPEKEPELTAEEQLQRLKKAESIRKMLSETTPIAREAQGPGSEAAAEEESCSLKLKMAADKRQREHLLHLNQLLAHQVMEKSKMVAVRALVTPSCREPLSTDDDDLSPVTPLPLVQQRENFFS